MPLSGSSLDPRKKGPTLLSISQPIDIYEQKPWLGGIWLSSMPEAPVVAQSPTRAPSSSSQHLHRQVGNGSLPPSAPKTPPKTSCTGNGSLPPSAPKTPPTYTQMTASTESDRSQTTDSNISKTVPEKLDKQSSVNSMLLYIVLYYAVHSVIVLFDYHRSGGSCVASGDYISATQLMLIAHSLSRPVLV